MKFRTDLKTVIDVELLEPEKTKAYFIDGDWKESFYTFNDLGDFCASLSYAFNFMGDRYNAELGTILRVTDGYGDYILQEDRSYKLDDETASEAGKIIIRYEQEQDIDYGLAKEDS